MLLRLIAKKQTFSFDSIYIPGGFSVVGVGAKKYF